MKLHFSKLSLLNSRLPLLVRFLKTNWSGAQLVLRKNLPEDGFYEFDFHADPPLHDGLYILMPISAEYIEQDFIKRINGVRIYAATNSIEQRLIETDIKKSEVTEEIVYPTLETLLGLKIDGNRLKAKVHSNGMTNRDSFSLEVIKGFTGVPPHYIYIKRLQSDQGKAYLPNGVEIEFFLDEVQENETFFVANQIKKKL